MSSGTCLLFQINVDMALGDYDAAMQLLADLAALVRADQLSLETRLHAIDHAITEAIGGSTQNAGAYARSVMLGLLEGGY